MAEALRRSPPPVYRMAEALGAELRRLSARFGPDAVAGLVPVVVRLLELLEAQGDPAAAEAEAPEAEVNNVARTEREVMLRLKEVVDKQRDELRAQAHEIVCKSRDLEALQEQLQRFMARNEELRHKVAVVQAQLRSVLEKNSDLEAAMLQIQRGVSRRGRDTSEIQQPKPTPGHGVGTQGSLPPEPQHQDAGRSPAHCCFSKEELQQILQERNELKTNLFLVQEELAYYQRELLNEERIPSLFLDAMKSTIKRQRKKIRAKMLGTMEEAESSAGHSRAPLAPPALGSTLLGTSPSSACALVMGGAGSHCLLGALIKVWRGLSSPVLLKPAACLCWGLCWRQGG
uniref:Uncharacterized protein n=1 Tax=Melopsittacus undulatus TaxID=13146 RepID=A0A8V5GSY2_MELUD